MCKNISSDTRDMINVFFFFFFVFPIRYGFPPKRAYLSLLRHRNLCETYPFPLQLDDFIFKATLFQSLYWTTENTVPRATLPGINPAKDKTFYIPPKGSGDNDLAISGSTA